MKWMRWFWAVLLIVWDAGVLLAFPFFSGGTRDYGFDTYDGRQFLGTLFGAVLLIVGVYLLIKFRVRSEARAVLKTVQAEADPVESRSDAPPPLVLRPGRRNRR